MPEIPSRESLEAENLALRKKLAELEKVHFKINKMLYDKGAPNGDVIYKLKYLLNFIDF